MLPAQHQTKIALISISTFGLIAVLFQKGFRDINALASSVAAPLANSGGIMALSNLRRRVVIVDDSRTVQAILDNAFGTRNDFCVVGFAGDAISAVEIIRRLQPDIVTIDLCMPYLDGAALLDMLRDMTTVCKIVVSDQTLTSLLLTSKLLEAGAALCLGKTDLIHNPTMFFKKINAAADAMAADKRPSSSAVRSASSVTNPIKNTSTTIANFSFPIPRDENDRINFIQQNKLANSVRERQFDLITKYVAKATGFPACLLTIIDRDTQWIKSAYGLDVDSTPRHQAFCNYTISQGGAFIVANAAVDNRFCNNPLVTGPPNIKCYAGHPIISRAGTTIAALCVIDTRVRAVSRLVVEQLAALSEIMGEAIEHRSSIAA